MWEKANFLGRRCLRRTATLKVVGVLATLVQKATLAIIVSLIATSAVAWILSTQQPDMMIAMTTYNPLAISLFTASWTAGMAAMMFPAIIPMVLLYRTLVTNMNGGNQNSVTVQNSLSLLSMRVALFVSSYLLVWALTGIVLLLGWSIVMNSTIMPSNDAKLLPVLYGSLLVIAGAYQFTPLKRTCIGYCESPMGFFTRRWKNGTFGALRMGVWHGLYCLGCCWSYFLLMVALGWMNLGWMALFAGIIFAEKMWRKGIWVARAAGAGLAITGILIIAGMIPSLLTSTSSMGMHQNNNSDIMKSMGANSVQNSTSMSSSPASPTAMLPNTTVPATSLPKGNVMQNSTSQEAQRMNMTG